MAEIGALKKRRAYIKGSMTKLQNYINAIDKTTTAEDIKVRLSNVERYRNEFIELENQIIRLDQEEDLDTTFEESYYRVVAGLNLALRSTMEPAGSLNETLANVSITGGQPDVKLPKIAIPSFSGDYTEWQSFYDLFCSTIHDNTRLTASQKLQYLKGAVFGEASGLLKHFSITDANYIEALQKLRDRYDRKKHTIYAFVKNFMYQPTITTSSSMHVRRLLDTSDEIIRGLKALGEAAESRDHWLIQIMVSKLDDETGSLWAQASADYDLPTIKQFFDFLTKRIDALESIKSQNRRSQPQAIQHKPSLKSHVVSGSQFQSCPLCPAEQHRLIECAKFKAISLDERRNLLKRDGRCFNCLSSNHTVFNCKSKFRCRECNRKHHTLLHDSAPMAPKVNETKPDTQTSEEIKTSYVANTNHASSLLPTAVVYVEDGLNQKQLCRVLLDSGSQGSFIAESCAQRLKLKRSSAKIAISGIGAATNGFTRGLVSLRITPWHKDEPKIQIEAFILPKLTTKQPSVSESIDLNHFNQYDLADPSFYKAREIDIIIGADTFFELLTEGRATYNGVTMQKTLLGWVAAGGSKGNQIIQSVTVNISNPEDNLENLLRKFWEIETTNDNTIHLSQEEKYCEKNFKETTTINNHGQFEVRLPFKTPPTTLGCSFRIAVQRMYSMERRFSRDPNFASMYKDFMQEYKQLGHMKEVTNDQTRINGYYLPHHGVLKDSSSTTKLRVVFDGSCKTNSGISLNDCLAVGPTVQPTLYQILCRFRKYKFAITADVEKMYRQVRVSQQDAKYQRILWRDTSSVPFTTYELQTVTYGTASASFLATRALNEAANKCRQEFPEAANRITNEMYVDDLMTGADSVHEAIKLKEEINLILSKSGFQLRKWLSNDSNILKGIIPTTTVPEILEIEEPNSYVKVLGLHWSPNTDRFQFVVQLSNQPILTKRGILSEASRLFDPLGWLAPVTVQIKIYFQALWTENLGWDDQLPTDLAAKWLQIRQNLPKVQEIQVERYLHTRADSKIILHGFSDASKQAYAAAVYGRITKPNGDIVIKLLSAKTKVAPIKQISIPRLELCGALLLTRLLSTVQKALQINVSEINAWTDSTIVLDWLSAHPSKWNTFVGNRTGEILSFTHRAQWRHVDSEDNPADCASRGVDPETLQGLSLWWNGPTWLKNCENSLKMIVQQPCKLEEKCGQILVIQTPPPNILDKLIQKFSNFSKIIRILAYIFRFIEIKLKRVSNVPSYLLTSEVQKSRRVILRHVQTKHFGEEISLIRAYKDLPKSSQLKQLRPFVDESQLLRVGGRLTNASITYDLKHPVILTANDQLTESIVREHHLRHLHAGPTLMMATLRNKYWIVGGRNLIRKVARSCVKCVKYTAKELNQVMSDLPNPRVELIRPFHKVGVDYAGPFPIHLRRGRGQKTYKGYMCIFVCLSTKAVHIDFVSDMTTDAYIAALRRFIARRGVPKEIISDNGTNFVGARNHLHAFYEFLKQNINIFSNFLLIDQIAFKFIPPGSPHFGGLWEAAVKSAKYHIRRVTDGHILTIEEITTLLAEVEAILNSRPICILSSDDIDYLTPGHFLIGRPTTQLPTEDLVNVKQSRLSRWQLLQKMNQHIWRRWSQEYLTNLQHRSKWASKESNAKIGDIVVIKENNLPPSKWLMGKVVELHPGPDNNIRVVTLKTSSGNIKRPIQKLCLLPVN